MTHTPLALSSALLLLAVAHAAASAAPLHPQVEQVLTRWLNTVVAAKAKPLRALSTPVETELFRRAEIDRAARAALIQLASTSPRAKRAAVQAAIWPEVRKIDQENVAYVKSVLPADGWFRRSRDGEIAASRAWLIVHHSEEWDFKRQVLGRLTELLPTGEIQPSSYATFYDRIAIHDGRPQRYGTQTECRNGRVVIAAIDDPAKLDARRASVGLESIADYAREFEKQRC